MSADSVPAGLASPRFAPQVVSSVVQYLNGVGFLHRAEMTDLRADTKYFYGAHAQHTPASAGVAGLSCASLSWGHVPLQTTGVAAPNANVLAGPFSFVAAPNREGGSVVAFYADFGYENAASLPQLATDVASGSYDAILHGGDIAYDLFELSGEQGSRFMRALEPVAANVPYMVRTLLASSLLVYDTRYDNSAWPPCLFSRWLSGTTSTTTISSSTSRGKHNAAQTPLLQPA